MKIWLPRLKVEDDREETGREKIDLGRQIPMELELERRLSLKPLVEKTVFPSYGGAKLGQKVLIICLKNNFKPFFKKIY